MASWWIRPARSISQISPAALRAHLAEPNAFPLKLTGIVSHWPALASWSMRNELQELRDIVGENTAVEVELGRRGRGYLDKGYRRVTMGFGLFLDAFVLGKVPSSSKSAASTATAKGKERAGAKLPLGYLAQHDLQVSPVVDEAIPTLEHYRSGPRKELWRRTLWVGPKGSWTPFHKDPYIGVYSQLIGTKTFHLLPPSSSSLLNLAGSPHTNTSSIPLPISALFPSSNHPPNSSSIDTSDLPDPLLEAYRTRLKEAFALPGACQVDLSAEESVLIPEGWFHSAEGTDVGVGVNAWFR